MEWPMADAEKCFGDVVALALTEGPQRVRRGDDVVIVLAESDYRRLPGVQQTFRDYLLDGPDLSELDLRRGEDSMRDV